MQLSIVDLGQVPASGTCADAFAATVGLAQLAERLGYHRYWIAEHHGRGETFASSNPEVLVAHVAAATTRIRVGSGGVLLNHYSPFKVAEVFRVLHALHPGRIDLGFGRADGIPVVDFALKRDREAPDAAGMLAWLAQEEQVRELVDWLTGSFPADHPFADVSLLPGVAGGPELWLLGATTASAALAGRLGLRFCFAGFLNPEGAVGALRTYRATAAAEPHAMLALNMTCAPTDAEADRLRASASLFWARARRGEDQQRPLPHPDDALLELGGPPAPDPRLLSGSPSRLREAIEELVALAGADEVIVQDLIADPAARRESYELLADVFDLGVDAPLLVSGGGSSP